MSGAVLGTIFELHHSPNLDFLQVLSAQEGQFTEITPRKSGSLGVGLYKSRSSAWITCNTPRNVEFARNDREINEPQSDE